MVGFGGFLRPACVSRALDMLARRLLFAMPALVLVGLGVRSEHAPGLRRDEVVCEDALARVEQCCGSSFTSNLSCTYVDNGDCTPPTLPDLDETEATTIREEKCEAVVSAGYCSKEFDHTPPESDE